MKLPFLDMRKKTLSEAIPLRAAFERVLASKAYVLGEECTAFERELGSDSAVGPERVVTCNSGTDALILAMKAMGVTAGSEVIVPAHTAVPTVAAIRALHAIPRFTEIDPRTWVMDSGDALRLIGPRTKAIIAVHLYGNCVQLSALSEVRHLVLEDVAQAQGAYWEEAPAGSWGRAGAFSFYPTKNLGALGDGGAVVFREASEAAAARKLRFYGQQNRNFAELDLGINSRLDELQAAFLRARLVNYRTELASKNRLRSLYLDLLRDLPLETQGVTAGCTPAWHLFVVCFQTKKDRDRTSNFLEQEGIGSLVHYPVPNHQQKAFEAFRDRSLPITESLCERILSLPLHGMMTESDVSLVSAAVWKALRG